MTVELYALKAPVIASKTANFVTKRAVSIGFQIAFMKDLFSGMLNSCHLPLDLFDSAIKF